MEIEVGDAPAGVAVLEDAEDQAAPFFRVDRAVEEGPPLDGVSVKGHRQGIMPGGRFEGGADRPRPLGGLEGHRRAVGQGRGIVRRHRRGVAAQEVAGFENHPLARVPARNTRADNAAAPREADESHPGGVLGLGDAGVPAALAEGEQEIGIGDAGAVVGDSDARGGGVLGRDGIGGHGNIRGAGPAAILQ